jgi:PPK2 family polyphosphate:nucleotide phosphotransferase
MRLKPVDPKATLSLSDRDARRPANAPPREEIPELIKIETKSICKLQRVLYADGGHALLVVLQGRDASGKDGTIRHVFQRVNPEGCEVTSFKAPTGHELRHDYLWRVHQRVPARGMIGIFNRSHYEDVLVPRVRETIKPREWRTRYREINDFERLLTEQGVVILKFFLHVSREEQKERLQRRLSDPTRNWKFREGDLGDRAAWSAFTAAYRDALRECSSEWAPWHVVPADDKELRDYLIARAIADTLDALQLRYPRAPAAVRNIKIF